MKELFWDEGFDWVDDTPAETQQEEQPAFDWNEARKYPDKALKVVLPIGAAVLAAFGIMELTRGGPSRSERLAENFQAASYSPHDISKFSFLVNMTPAEVDAGVIRNRIQFSKSIQDAAARVSLSAYRQGLDNKGMSVDMYDVVDQLVPQEAQLELAEDGVEFTGVTPVHCDIIYGTGNQPYSPMDYSNHPPSDFKVRERIVDGQQKTSVPLGTEQMPTYDDVVDDLAINPIPYTLNPDLPCVELYPHPTYGPNEATYPKDSDFVFLLW
jgi:hypothetical protein